MFQNGFWVSFILCVLMAFGTVGCGNKQKECDAGYISAHHQVGSSAKSLLRYFNLETGQLKSGYSEKMALEAARDLDRKCDVFLGSYGGVSCTGLSEDTGSEMTTNPAALEAACTKIKQALQGNTAAEVTFAVNPRDGSEALNSLDVEMMVAIPSGKNVEFISPIDAP